MSSFWVQTLSFVFDTFFDILTLILALRLLLQIAHADYFNPIVKLCVNLTQWIVRPLQFIFPQFFGIDLAVIVCLLLLEALKIILLNSITWGEWPDLTGMIIWILADIFNLFLNLWFYALLLRVLLSWALPFQHHRLSTVLLLVTEPLLKPLRCFIPLVNGRLDFTPLVWILVIYFLRVLLATPLLELGMRLANPG